MRTLLIAATVVALLQGCATGGSPPTSRVSGLDGSRLVRRPLRDWPSWADDLNPLRDWPSWADDLNPIHTHGVPHAD